MKSNASFYSLEVWYSTNLEKQTNKQTNKPILPLIAGVCHIYTRDVSPKFTDKISRKGGTNWLNIAAGIKHPSMGRGG